VGVAVIFVNYLVLAIFSDTYKPATGLIVPCIFFTIDIMLLIFSIIYILLANHMPITTKANEKYMVIHTILLIGIFITYILLYLKGSAIPFVILMVLDLLLVANIMNSLNRNPQFVLNGWDYIVRNVDVHFPAPLLPPVLDQEADDEGPEDEALFDNAL
jgi:hypothetical protein